MCISHGKRLQSEVSFEQHSVGNSVNTDKILNVQRLAKSRHLLQLAIMGSSVNADYNI